MKGHAGYTPADWLWIGLAALAVVPFVAVRFSGLATGSVGWVAATTGLAIIAAAFFLSWGVEALETEMPLVAALAILALIEVAPEYAFEAVLAFRQKTTLAAASMTGANRLLLGLGWPLIFFVARVSARRKGIDFREIVLDSRHSVTVLFLLIASLYAFVIVVKGTLSIVDAVALISIYVLYIFATLRSGRSEEHGKREIELGIAARTKQLAGAQRWTAVTLFLGIGAMVLYFGAEPFIDAIIASARELGLSEFAVIQWLAPFLSEFPESLTAFIWAAMVFPAAIGLSSLISSKLNQWTLLIATVPIAYSLGAGRLQVMHLTAHVRDEMFLTAAQSVFGVVLLLPMRFSLAKAWVLLGMFLAQFLIPSESVHVILAWVYIALSVMMLIRNWRQVTLWRDVREVLSPNR